jgi:hypothetical protein
MQVQPGILQIIDKCDGSRTPAELHRAMVDAELFPGDASEDSFLEIVAALISAGILYPAGAVRPTGKQPTEALA